MLTINVITLFPDLFSEHLKNLPFKKAIMTGVIKVNLINLREFGLDNYGTVDDKPYGGGTGMLLMIEPVYNALATIYGADFESNKPNRRVVALTPRGKIFNQAKAREFSDLQEITFICGRYEGMDARIEDNLATEKLSIGNYVLSGGELPCLVVMEALTRIQDGILEKEDAALKESFTEMRVEHPQYTRPEEFKGMKVPEILLSGDHKRIEQWKEQNMMPMEDSQN